MSLTQDIDNYLNDLESVRRASPLTVKNYRSTLGAYARKHRILNDVNVKAFLRGFSHPPTANTSLVRLQGFADYLEIPLRVSRAKEIVKDPEAMSSAEVDSLLQVCDEVHPALRDQVYVMVRTGLRIQEFLSLDEYSLTEREGVSNLKVLGKGQKIRFVPLSTDTAEAFRRLRMPLRMPIRRFRERLAKAGELANIPFHVNPHKLRSSCASILMNERGADSALVAKIMGWSKVDTMVARYYKPNLKRLHSVL